MLQGHHCCAGGLVVLAETFSHEIYRQSLARLFELDEHGHLQMYFNATLDVAVSRVSSLASQMHLFVLCQNRKSTQM